MFVQQEIAGEASAHPASGRRRGVFDGRARLLRPFSSDDAARTSSPDRARGTHAVTAPVDSVLVRGVYRREWAWRALSEAGSLSYTRRGAATKLRAFQVRGARIGSGDSPDAAPGWAPRMLGRLASSRAASIIPAPPRSLRFDSPPKKRSMQGDGKPRARGDVTNQIHNRSASMAPVRMSAGSETS